MPGGIEEQGGRVSLIYGGVRAVQSSASHSHRGFSPVARDLLRTSKPF